MKNHDYPIFGPLDKHFQCLFNELNFGVHAVEAVTEEDNVESLDASTAVVKTEWQVMDARRIFQGGQRTVHPRDRAKRFFQCRGEELVRFERNIFGDFVPYEAREIFKNGVWTWSDFQYRKFGLRFQERVQQAQKLRYDKVSIRHPS